MVMIVDLFKNNDWDLGNILSTKLNQGGEGEMFGNCWMRMKMERAM